MNIAKRKNMHYKIEYRGYNAHFNLMHSHIYLKDGCEYVISPFLLKDLMNAIRLRNDCSIIIEPYAEIFDEDILYFCKLEKMKGRCNENYRRTAF